MSGLSLVLLLPKVMLANLALSQVLTTRWKTICPTFHNVTPLDLPIVVCRKVILQISVPRTPFEIQTGNRKIRSA